MSHSRIPRLLLGTAVLALLSPAGAPAHDEPLPASGEKLGTVDFPIACNAEAQQRFNRAVAILHSFWYEEASKAFDSVVQADPGCAMAYWGVAMSQWYPLWYPPSPASLKKGSDAVAKAEALGGKSERERGYIAAIASFYRDSDKLDHRARSQAYEQAMAELYARNPDDREAAVFYALALDTTAPTTDKSYANQKRAAAILEKVFAEEPNHPGVAHYLIHSYDSAPLAEQGLGAARRYAGIAPSVPHALHMPSHIFTRVGSWQESIESNLASAQAGMAYAKREFGEEVAWPEALHAMDYLEYAYLQGAQDGAAKRVVDEVMGFRKSGQEVMVAGYALAAIPARYAVERRQWREAASVRLPPLAFPWEKFPWTASMVSFTRALGAARTGTPEAAEVEIANLAAARDALLEQKNKYWADQVEVQRLAAAAMLQLAKGRQEEALAGLRAAAELEASMDKHPVTPGGIVPIRELLGDVLLELGQSAPALDAYERSLAADPRRFRSLYGAAKSAERLGDAKAKAYYAEVAALGSRADTERPELVEARAFIAR
jgi:tetratricopeptide (TPR) repeat protein